MSDPLALDHKTAPQRKACQAQQVSRLGLCVLLMTIRNSISSEGAYGKGKKKQGGCHVKGGDGLGSWITQVLFGYEGHVRKRLRD